MSSFPGTPKTLQGGLVLLDPDTAQVRRVIVLQYNPDTLTRSFQPQAIGPDSGDRLEALRLKGPAVETIKLEAELDAADQLEFPDNNPTAVNYGIHPQLAALQSVVNPLADDLQSARDLAGFGTLEVAPAESPLTVFVWGPNRIVPVRLSELTVTEEAFDTRLNPIRAKVSLGMRVLSPNDLSYDHRGSSIFLAYLRQQERFSGMAATTALLPLGIESIP
jgi:hypothetical protein